MSATVSPIGKFVLSLLAHASVRRVLLRYKNGAFPTRHSMAISRVAALKALFEVDRGADHYSAPSSAIIMPHHHAAYLWW